jgi:alpha-amylase/alpha-mannosidase (GH57 family)
LWPSEGSVSDAIVPLVADAGFAWMATDELILARTLGIPLTRDSRGNLEQPERLYAPYALKTGGGTLACAFRDHAMSISSAAFRLEFEAAAETVGRLPSGPARRKSS